MSVVHKSLVIIYLLKSYSHYCLSHIYNIIIYIICLNEKKIAYSFKISDDSSSNLGQDLEGE